ncbi:MAG: hypothetical protein LBK82_15420 [Planctomycetaceae bacterium]|jgi:chromosome segregation ATPase|nr:hypothetical protein [Planctomycetaceae bacterium]
MFTRLRLHNFQNHRNLEIPLSQITTIVGESDSGKSAIVRALQWLCLNSLQGDSFITHGKKKCFVQLDILNYGQIARRKSSSVNGYVLENEEERNAVGREVPSDIAKILNIGEINISSQHSPIFWFTLTPGQLAKELNSIADIAWLDRIMQTSGSNLRKAQSELDVTAGRVTSLEKSIKETEWTENADTILKSLEDQQSNLQKTETQISKLTDIIDKIAQSQTEIDIANEIIHDFQHLTPQYEEAVQQQTAFQRITSLIDSYPNITESFPLLQSLKQIFQHAHSPKTQYDSLTNILFNVPDIQEFPDVTPLRNLFENLYNQKSQYDKLANLISQNIEEVPDASPLATLLEKTTSRQKQSNRLSELIDQLTDMTNQYNEAHNQLQESERDLHEQLEGVCPICGQAI